MTYNDLVDNNYGFTQILETLVDLYAKKQTMSDHQKAVDNFIRLKGEELPLAMGRVKILANRLQSSSDHYAWPETRHRMLRSVLKQIILPATRRDLDLKEFEALEAGGKTDIDTLVKIADRYERVNDMVPTSDCATIFMSASCQPKITAIDQQNQISALKKEKSSEKSELKQIKDDLTQLLQTANVQFAKRSVSFDKKREKLREIRAQRSSSSGSHRSAPDTDTEMKDDSTTPTSSSGYYSDTGKNDRADRGRKRTRYEQGYPKPSGGSSGYNQNQNSSRYQGSSASRSGNNSSRFRSSSGYRNQDSSGYKRSVTPHQVVYNGYSNDRRPSRRDQSGGSQNRQQYSGSRQGSRQGSRSGSANQNQHQNQNRSKTPDSIVVQIDIGNGSKTYEKCKCGSFHRPGFACQIVPKNQ